MQLHGVADAEGAEPLDLKVPRLRLLDDPMGH
jgi:hypothetical protein